MLSAFSFTNPRWRVPARGWKPCSRCLQREREEACELVIAVSFDLHAETKFFPENTLNKMFIIQFLIGKNYLHKKRFQQKPN